MQPDEISPTCVRAVQFHRAGDLQNAERLYRQAVAEAPDAYFSRYLLGVVLFHRGCAADALEELDRAITRELHAEALNIRGLVLEALGRDDAALADFDQALTLEPGYDEALNNRGNALLRLKRPAEALLSLERATALEPAAPQGWNNQAVALHRLGRLDEALASIERSLTIDPRSAAAWTNRGLVLYALTRLDEAVQSYDRAIACDPASVDAHWNKGIVLLLLGNFRQGWPLYEWRLQQGRNNATRQYAQPRWQGDAPLRGQTLYLYAEQGLGDTLQFSRYARMAAERGARVILSVQDSLVPLLQGEVPGVDIRSFHAAPDQFDYHAPLLSLPGIFGTDAATIPPGILLHADGDRTAAWARRIGDHGFRIGVVWQGKPGDTVDVGRSFPLARLAPIAAMPGVRLVSLQKQSGLEQLSTLPAGMKVETLGEKFDAEPAAFLDTAAVMASLDLIITSDTAVAHLAGALQRPVWVALQHVPDWRWRQTGATTSWYPGMILFRQPVRGEWEAVFAAMQEKLAT